MAKIIFWEKPGCRGNKKQKAILEASGHQLEVRNLLGEHWTAETLRPFFGLRPVSTWFNPSNPQIKTGDIVPGALSEQQALDLMVAEPLLILRPLMQVGEQRSAGFDVPHLHAWIGLDLQAVGEGDPQQCQHPAKACG